MARISREFFVFLNCFEKRMLTEFNEDFEAVGSTNFLVAKARRTGKQADSSPQSPSILCIRSKLKYSFKSIL